MRKWIAVSGAMCALLAGSGFPGWSQTSGESDKRALISIFRVAPGKHLDFLKWQAARAAIATEAGAAATQWYVHQNGDSWDFVSVGEVPSPEQEAAQDEKIETLTKERGLTTGMAAALEFRQFVAFHTDTDAGGPFTAQELVEQASER